MNVTRADMVTAGWSPSVRLFEAAACAVPLISDPWPGLDAAFVPGAEIVIAQRTADVVRTLAALTEADCRRLLQLQLARRGADVLAIDVDEHYLVGVARSGDHAAQRRVAASRPEQQALQRGPWPTGTSCHRAWPSARSGASSSSSG